MTKPTPLLEADNRTTMSRRVRERLKPGKGNWTDHSADPALGAFLDLAAADIEAHPERLRAFDGGLHDRLKALAGDIDIDLDEPH